MPLPKKYAFGRIKELGPELIKQVDDRLMGGDTAVNVATWLQKELGKFTDLQLASLKKNIERYRAVDLKDRVVSDLVGGTKGMTVKTLLERMNAMQEMELLCGIQKGRVEKLLVQEAKLPAGVVLKGASDEIRLLKENLVELGKLQLETGVLKRAPKNVSGTVMDPMSGEVKTFQWTEEQATLMRELETIDLEAADVTEPVDA